MSKHIAAALIGAAIISLAGPIAATQAMAATYVASFSGVFGDGNPFNGKIFYDADLVTSLHNHSILSYSLSSNSFTPYFGKSNLSDADFPSPSEYVMTVSTKANGNSADYDKLGFTLQPFPYGLTSVDIAFWVNYKLGSLGNTIISSPPSNDIITSSAGHGGFIYDSALSGGFYSVYGGTIDDFSIMPAVNSAVPEPATWGMMIAGVGMAGATLRRRRRSAWTVQAA